MLCVCDISVKEFTSLLRLSAIREVDFREGVTVSLPVVIYFQKVIVTNQEDSIYPNIPPNRHFLPSLPPGQIKRDTVRYVKIYEGANLMNFDK